MTTPIWIILCIVFAAVGAGAAYILSSKASASQKEARIRSEAEMEILAAQNAELKKANLLLDEKFTDANDKIKDAEVMLSAQIEKARLSDEQNNELKSEVEWLKKENAELNRSLQKASAEYSAETEKNKWVSEADKKMREAFDSISKQIIENTNADFLTKANDKLNDFASKLNEKMEGENKAVANILTPVSENLTELKKHIGELETRRSTAYAELNQTVSQLKNQNDILTNEARNLNSALRNSSVRGKWGEAQLKRVAELSGMTEHIDFEEQYVNTDGKRPDMLIRLTGDRSIPVDSKVPMDDYLKFAESMDESDKKISLDNHVRAVKKHIDALSKKEYWKNEARSIEMVVLVIPYESGLSAAFEGDPEIFNYAVNKNVLLLSPVTFYAFLKSCSIGWSEYNLAQSAKEIAALSKELVERFDVFYKHMNAVGVGIDKAAESYNKAIGSYNSRLSPTFNKIRSLKQLDEAQLLETVNESVVRTGLEEISGKIEENNG